MAPGKIEELIVREMRVERRTRKRGEKGRKGGRSLAELRGYRNSYGVRYRIAPSRKMRAHGQGYVPASGSESKYHVALRMWEETVDILPLKTAAKSLTSFPAQRQSRFHPLERETLWVDLSPRAHRILGYGQPFLPEMPEIRAVSHSAIHSESQPGSSDAINYRLQLRTRVNMSDVYLAKYISVT